MSKNNSWYSGLLGYLGGGPWLVADECPAIRHNTLSSAIGRQRISHGETRSGLPRCVCPHATAMLDEYKARRASGERRRPLISEAVEVNNRNNIRVPNFISNTLASGMPDLSKGKCRTQQGRDIIDRAEGKQPNSAAVLRARFLCADCPVMEKCGEWVKRDEKPAGSWGLMYAGMTPRERIRESRGVRA
jgi:hypothetical protein